MSGFKGKKSRRQSSDIFLCSPNGITPEIQPDDQLDICPTSEPDYTVYSIHAKIILPARTITGVSNWVQMNGYNPDTYIRLAVLKNNSI